MSIGPAKEIGVFSLPGSGFLAQEEKLSLPGPAVNEMMAGAATLCYTLEKEDSMDVHLNRRQWLKTSAAAVAGWIAGPGLAITNEGRFSRAEFGSEGLIRLHNNESHFGISESAREAIRDGLDDCSAYPDDRYHELKELIAVRENLSPENIILGAGSIEIITACLHAYVSRGGALVSDPTYFDFVDYAGKARCPLRRVALTDQYGLDLPAMKKQAGSGIGLIYICNPQNPTGAMTPGAQLRPFCRNASRKALIVLDEAYCDYVEDNAYSSMADLVREGENIVVTRTFSKVFGLAGLRIGYGLARTDIIQNLARLERNFAPVSSLALRAAVASYQDEEFIQKVRRQNQGVKEYMYEELKRLGYAFLPSHTNFILFKVRRDCQELADKMESHSILVRPFKLRGANCIRVSLGTLAEMKTFITHLQNLDRAEEGANVSS